MAPLHRAERVLIREGAGGGVFNEGLGGLFCSFLFPPTFLLHDLVLHFSASLFI